MMELAQNEPPLVNLEDFKSWILYEDDQILVVNKPGWLVCHPSKNGPLSSLVGAAKVYLGTESLHLASRLDRETSGVVLFAKNRKAASLWQKGIETKKVRRSYLAILKGKLEEQRMVSTFLGNDPESKVHVKQRVTSKSNKAKHAETIFSPLIHREGYTFCLVTTSTGRKHQIRVHAQWINCPLVGEKLYGRDENIYLDLCSSGWKPEWNQLLGMYRQALHGRCLADKGFQQVFLSPLPNDYLDFLYLTMMLQPEEVQELVRLSDAQYRTSILAN